MDDLQLEHAFLKAPCEAQAKIFRQRKKAVHKEVEALVAMVNRLGGSPSPAALLPVAKRLAELHRVINETRQEEVAATRQCDLRLSHLRQKPTGTGQGSQDSSAWEKTRLDRMLVDYMLREGLHGPAEKVAASCRIQHLVELGIFAASRTIVIALRAKDCIPALKWCAENKRRLAKIQSNLEFSLRLQEFVELARKGDKAQAIKYVRNHFAPFAADPVRASDVQRAMALLAFGPDTDCQPYKDMYDEERWDELVHAFNSDNYRLHGLPRESLLEITLKSGLASLKNRQCGEPGSINPNCPTCVEPFLTLARDLPRAQHVHSVLVCHISKKVMDENNPPMVLPNGNVYSNECLLRIASMNNGDVVDPRTGERFALKELRKCFIM